MFPLDSLDIDKFIFDEAKDNWKNYISNIKKILSPTCITTNDTVLEEKSNKIDNKNNFIVDSNNNSFEEKNGGLFNYNDDENYDDFM